MSSQPDAPAPPPSASETTAQALQAELAAYPQFREQGVQDILAYGQAAASLYGTAGLDLQRKQQALYEELYPEATAAEKEVANKIIAQLNEGLSPDLEASYARRFRGEEARAGRLDAPIGSTNIARQLTELDQAARDYAMQAGLSFIGRTPVAQANLPIDNSTQVGSFVPSFLNYNQGIYGTQANTFGTNAQYSTNRNQQYFDLAKSASAGASGLKAFAPFMA